MGQGNKKTPEEIAKEKARIRALDLNYPTNPLRLKEYARHWNAVENAESKVDSKNPMVLSEQVKESYRRDRNSIRLEGQRQLENIRLTKNIASILGGTSKAGLSHLWRDAKPERTAVHDRTYERTVKTLKIMRENILKYNHIQNVKPTYSRKEIQKWYEKQEETIDKISKYPNPNATGPGAYPARLRRIMEKSKANPKQHAYLLVEVEDKVAENIVVELFANLCPFTAKNFQRLCRNTKKTSCDCQTYRCKKVSRLRCVQDFDGNYNKLYWVVGEDVESLPEYTSVMIKEDSKISHTEKGLVTRPRNLPGGVFFITTGPCTHLDEFCNVFGKVTGDTMSFLEELEEKNVEENGQPIINMHVTDCGIAKKPEEIPPPMLLRDFISMVRLEIMPFIRKNPDKPDELSAGTTAFADYLKGDVRRSMDYGADDEVDDKVEPM